jgi:periplasmic copper chaperone A
VQKNLRHGATATVIALLSLPALAQVTVTDPWVRATVQGQTATGAFMKLQSAADAKLVEARSPVAAVVEIHEMAMENNVMRMRAVKSIELAAGRAVELKPGGYHVMLMDLKRQVKDGEVVPVTLVVETAGKREAVEVQAAARTTAPRNNTMKNHGH